MTLEHREQLEFIHDLHLCGISLTQLMALGAMDTHLTTKGRVEEIKLRKLMNASKRKS